MKKQNYMQIDLDDIIKQVGIINWKELERFFASGKLIFIDKRLDIIDVAYKIKVDDSDQIKKWIEENKLKFVSDDKAKLWSSMDAKFTSIVVAPWVLIQKANEIDKKKAP